MGIFKKARNEGGGSLIEFAIILPLLLIFLFGIIESGLVLYNKAVITNASREGARYGIVAHTPRRTNSEIELAVLKYCEDRLISVGGEGNPTVIANTYDTNANGNNTDFGDDLEVQVNWSYPFLALPNLLDLLGSGFDNPINLSAKTVMKYE